jgi:hypothetical protein
MSTVSNPLLYQLNTRVKQQALSHGLVKPLSLDDWPDREWDQLAEQGFHWLWLLGVWQTGAAGRHAPELLELQRGLEKGLTRAKTAFVHFLEADDQVTAKEVRQRYSKQQEQADAARERLNQI